MTRVLLIAEACNPQMVSVPLVGWSHVDAVRKLPDIDALIVTQVRNREALLQAGLREDTDFVAIDSERIAKPAWKAASLLRGGSNKGWTTVTAIATLTYPYFENLIWKRFGSQIQDGSFDLVHRVTPLSPTAPSRLAHRCRRAKVPFVLGPLNGGVPWPKQFDAARRREREWLSYVRSGYKLLPGYRQTRRDAAALMIGSQDTWQQVPQEYREKCVYIPENGIDPDRFSGRRNRQAEQPLRLVFLGRLVPYKGADMVIEAAADLIRSEQAVLTIVGDGPERETLERQAEMLGIGNGVRFVGRVPHEAVQQHLIESDLFVFPSIREFGGAVALEAMAVGLVPLVVRYGGLAELVTDQTGFTVEIGSRQEIIQQLRPVLERVAADPSLIETRSQAAHQRAMEWFSWEAKARQVREVYRWVLGQRSEKPDWGMPFPDVENVSSPKAVRQQA
ncbi:glycosyltransferase family 4 protein [Roseiconus nitratireducens]|uniref:Glycosyltransferase family 4 protein n=1 Tax=Roseiconus nitratireducens TaxID=2605748 RepID=A0A5M6DIS7_9BACT|nr:glycosyltransferase family 4 protein [Roseiconus nitratireducens]KAA5546140.1 glycosyltransferase family 4 protein [Roseiconus nitratireducens]